jgi:hypothetical protein
MHIQYVSKYIALSEEGLVSKMECPLDQGPLFCNQDHDESVFLYCLSCDYKKTLGASNLDKIKKEVEDALR